MAKVPHAPASVTGLKDHRARRSPDARRCSCSSSSSTSSTSRSSTSPCPRSGTTSASRRRACSGSSAATCSPTAASCCSAAAPPTSSAAAASSSAGSSCSRSPRSPAALGADRGAARRRPARPGRGRRDDVAGRALRPDHDLHRPARPQPRARRMGRRPRSRRRLRRRPQRRPHRGPRLALDLLPQRACRGPRRPGRARAPRRRARGAQARRLRPSGGGARHRRDAAPDLRARPRPRDRLAARPRRSPRSRLAAVLLAAFVANERRARNPLVPFSIFRIKGLAAANVTQLITFSGLYSMFFFLSLYMQSVLGYSPPTPASPTCR